MNIPDEFDSWCKSTEFDRSDSSPIEDGAQRAICDAHLLMLEMLKQLAHEKERADFAWKNVREIDKAREQQYAEIAKLKQCLRK